MRGMLHENLRVLAYLWLVRPFRPIHVPVGIQKQVENVAWHKNGRKEKALKINSRKIHSGQPWLLTPQLTTEKLCAMACSVMCTALEAAELRTQFDFWALNGPANVWH